MSRTAQRWDIRQASRELWIVFATLLFANAAFYFVLVRPRVDEHAALTTANAPKIAELERREKTVEAREAYLQGLEQVQDDLRRLRSEVLQTRDERMISVQEDVWDLAQDFNIDIEQVTFQNEVLEEEGIDRYAMTVPLRGGYANLRRFIQAVEESDTFLVVERVALGEGEEGGVLLQLNITLATYFDLPEFERERKAAGRPERKA